MNYKVALEMIKECLEYTGEGEYNRDEILSLYQYVDIGDELTRPVDMFVDEYKRITGAEDCDIPDELYGDDPSRWCKIECKDCTIGCRV